jgi:serine/threonine protein kinase
MAPDYQRVTPDAGCRAVKLTCNARRFLLGRPQAEPLPFRRSPTNAKVTSGFSHFCDKIRRMIRLRPRNSHRTLYEVLAPIRAGGIGAVYNAGDIRLGRECAIKALKGKEFSERFERGAE